MANLTTRSRSADPNVSEWVDQSPITFASGESFTFSLTWLGATSVTTATARIFKGSDTTTDYSDSYMPTGSHTYSGNVATFKPLRNFVDIGAVYVVVFACTVDGNVEHRKLKVVVIGPIGPVIP